MTLTIVPEILIPQLYIKDYDKLERNFICLKKFVSILFQNINKVVHKRPTVKNFIKKNTQKRIKTSYLLHRLPPP
jgi:hypothetical protein